MVELLSMELLLQGEHCELWDKFHSVNCKNISIFAHHLLPGDPVSDLIDRRQRPTTIPEFPTKKRGL